MAKLKLEKKYISIDEASKILNLNKHVIRYWDSKFDGISTRLENKKQRFFNIENINKINDIKNVIYQDGKHIYSLDIVEKILKFKKNDDNIVGKTENTNFKKSLIVDKSNFLNIRALKEIRENLKKLII